MDKYDEWINGNFLSDEEKNELSNMTTDEIKDAFSCELEFGTAGIRGKMGLGTNRINKYTISKVTLGLARYLNKTYSNPKVVIAYDTRKNSKEFAEVAALILNYNKIETYIYPEVASTPELSFAVTYLGCDSGIVITSSHNASIYNGYKVYNKYGSQIVNPEDMMILDEINNIKDFNEVKKANIDNSYYHVLDDNIRKDFVKENLKVILNKDIIDNYSSKIKVTYTSLHGTGMKIAPMIFDLLKVNVNYVNEQITLDGDFTYAKEPNPEYIDNYDLAIKYAKENNSDIIFASDPDSDRLGVMIKTPNGYELINGNVIGYIFTYYLLSNHNYNGKYIVRSIVTSNLVDKIARSFNVETKEVLTGCKNIAKVRNNNKDNYLFGFEESLGYMFDINVNDKNSFSSIIFMIEILSYLKSINKTLYEYIIEIYQKYGYYYTNTISIIDDSVDGITNFNNKMNIIRNGNIFNEKEKEDYIIKNDDLKSNCIKIIMNENEYFMIRPSGTEPKMKIYFIVNSSSMNEAIKNEQKIEKEVLEKLNSL